MEFRIRDKVRIRHLIRSFQGWLNALGFRMLTTLARFIRVRFRQRLEGALHRGLFPPRSIMLVWRTQVRRVR